MNSSSIDLIQHSANRAYKLNILETIAPINTVHAFDRVEFTDA